MLSRLCLSPSTNHTLLIETAWDCCQVQHSLDSKSKAPELQILKRSEPNKQVLKKTESEIQKPGFQRKKAVSAKSKSKTKGFEPGVWKKTRQGHFRQ